METVAAKIREILIENFGCDESEVGDDQTLTGNLGMDSIEIVQLGLDIEEIFNVEVPDEAVAANMTVGEVIAAVYKLTQV